MLKYAVPVHFHREMRVQMSTEDWRLRASSHGGTIVTWSQISTKLISWFWTATHETRITTKTWRPKQIAEFQPIYTMFKINNSVIIVLYWIITPQNILVTMTFDLWKTSSPLTPHIVLNPQPQLSPKIRSNTCEGHPAEEYKQVTGIFEANQAKEKKDGKGKRKYCSPSPGLSGQWVWLSIKTTWV